jgi:ATP-dependent helicase/nuclease subunit A
MSAYPDVPAHVRKEQCKASNPDISVWVSANAGTGKTHVLAWRVLRLLLAGVPPAKILCLTFTKAAAANMAERVFKALSEWTELDDLKLTEAISSIGAPEPSPEALIFARRLFARTVETPGGLKIHTIHGFCERLLHLFPFEANVPARFEVTDEIGETELLAAARREALAAACADRGELGRAVQHLAAETSQEEFDKLLTEATAHRALLRHDTIADAAADLHCALNLPPDMTLAKIEAEMIAAGIAPERWHIFADFLDTGSKADCKQATLLRQALEIHESARVSPAATMVEDARASCLGFYLEIFFVDGGAGDKRKSLATKPLTKGHPDLVAELYREQERLDPLRALHKAAECFERSLALTTIVAKVFARYEHMKGARGLLDFDDLIKRTLALLARSDARWVLCKLDYGIDHILVDEAQDTSEVQWKILEELTSEFFAGAGSRASHRTFFAVGDEKQSIFSFQGAAPTMFHEMRMRFETSFRNGGEIFEHVRLKDSFRSVPPVLEIIDQVFGNTEHQKGLVSDDIWMGHDGLKRDLPGLVEIWPPFAAEPREEPRDWRLPLDLLDEHDPASVLAERVAGKIAALTATDAGEYVYDSDKRRFRPVAGGDILILVRTRGAFFDAVIRALKQNDVPVAGADRLDLFTHIAVMDLIAAGRAALLTQDDLTLASVLKSPLVGLDDDDLLKIAPHRAGSLFDALAASPETRHRIARAAILRWRGRIALSPFNFYVRLLGEDGGRRAIEARLGPEACDAMDEFLRLALKAEKDGCFSLSAFLADVGSVEHPIKRDMETSSGCVRVMTIHAAKGLEAKIVFLPDTCGLPSGRHDHKIHVLKGHADAPVLAWSARKDDDPTAVATARQAARAEAEDEHRRLLYVAMTRAEERLYIGGFHGKNEPNDLAWSKMIAASLGGDFIELPPFEEGEKPILRRVSPGTIEREFDMAAAAPATQPSLPDFLTRPAPREIAPLPPLRPSSALAAAEAPYDDASAALPRAALERGRLMHVLLQYLPDVAAEARQRTAEAFLAARTSDLDASTRTALVGEALAALAMPTLSALFGPRARGEVAVVGRVTMPDGQERAVSGQIDRLVETEHEVIIADYKTGAPCTAEATPQAYLIQMALHRAVLTPLWPEKRLRMLLIWMAGPKVVELGGAQMDKALADFASQD